MAREGGVHKGIRKAGVHTRCSYKPIVKIMDRILSSCGCGVATQTSGHIGVLCLQIVDGVQWDTKTVNPNTLLVSLSVSGAGNLSRGYEGSERHESGRGGGITDIEPCSTVYVQGNSAIRGCAPSDEFQATGEQRKVPQPEGHPPSLGIHVQNTKQCKHNMGHLSKT